MKKWLDNTFIPQHPNYTDKHDLDREIWNETGVYVVRVNSLDKSVPVKDAWTNHFTIKTQGCTYINIYTNFDMALNECRRLEYEHPNAYLRVERVSLARMLDDSSWIGRLYNAYGEVCYICDGKRAFPNDYYKRWPTCYPEDANKDKNKDDGKIKIGFEVPEPNKNTVETEETANNENQ